jgi:hypothetical protein
MGCALVKQTTLGDEIKRDSLVRLSKIPPEQLPRSSRQFRRLLRVAFEHTCVHSFVWLIEQQFKTLHTFNRSFLVWMVDQHYAKPQPRQKRLTLKEELECIRDTRQRIKTFFTFLLIVISSAYKYKSREIGWIHRFLKASHRDSLLHLLRPFLPSKSSFCRHVRVHNNIVYDFIYVRSLCTQLESNPRIDYGSIHSHEWMVKKCWEYIRDVCEKFRWFDAKGLFLLYIPLLGKIYGFGELRTPSFRVLRYICRCVSESMLRELLPYLYPFIQQVGLQRICESIRCRTKQYMILLFAHTSLTHTLNFFVCRFFVCQLVS